MNLNEIFHAIETLQLEPAKAPEVDRPRLEAEILELEEQGAAFIRERTDATLGPLRRELDSAVARARELLKP